MAYTVFISSTRQDLIPYREAVIRHLHKNRYVTWEMEASVASDQEPLEACLQEVAESDLFVGIYADRYGFVPPESMISITEQELLEAERLRKPIFCFLADESLGWPRDEEEEKAPKLKELKRRIQDRYMLDGALTGPFTTPDGLAVNIITALNQWEKRQQPAKLSPERHLQLALVEKVERLWIDGVLRKAVPEGRRLRVGREERPEAVGRPVPEGAVPEAAASEVVEPIQYLFRRGRSLLLLGPAGSGKTIALLELVHWLAREADRDPEAAVPVVFNLASWKGHDRSLAGWMASELNQHYKASLKDSAEWIERDQILPLLDGLDEVEPDCRPGCVDAINAHLREHGLATGMAVACHTQVYEELPARLQLETAVALRPLTPAQVDEHLGAAGPALAGLRAALAGDIGLRELAASPLMLTLLERTFQNAAPEDLPSGRAVGIGRVFEAYVIRALEPGRELPWAREETARPRGLRSRLPWNRYQGGAPAPPPEGRYSPQRTRRSLAWLAHGMAEHDPALFQVERLQPAWLTSRRQVFGYAVLSRALGGGLLGLPLALSFGRPDLAGAGLTAGALVGALETARLCRRTPPAGSTGDTLGRLLVQTLLLSGAVLFSVLLMGIPWVAAVSDSQQAWRFGLLLRAGLLFGLLFGVVFGVRGTGRGGNGDTRVAEALVWRAWSWRGTVLGASSLVVFSLACWGLLRLSDASVSYLDAGFWVPFSLIVALLGGILFGALGGLGGRALEEKDWPNQGTWLALRNAGVTGLITALAAALALGLALGGIEAAGRIAGEDSVLPRGTLPWLPLRVGWVLGVWAGLAYSGLDFVQHFSLRLVLRLARLVPGRLVGFLDHAVERGLLQRPGGSYKFFHPLLLEHFAKSYGSPARTP